MAFMAFMAAMDVCGTVVVTDGCMSAAKLVGDPEGVRRVRMGRKAAGTDQSHSHWLLSIFGKLSTLQGRGGFALCRVGGVRLMAMGDGRVGEFMWGSMWIAGIWTLSSLGLPIKKPGWAE